ncbi:hypothetical protein DYB32_000542 [Aphanomyces invadans]|uniref:IPO4/5-like TPR repeats domain-containing protein n=1 Tax=Aphanomyces invadans TaxID=157072 RepID=A0A3R6Z5V4_9STRA|nr:hypothetical protein DYB32_000542 [Aphanomyces invadans]
MVHTDVIRALLSNDNTVRRQAESTYTQIKAHQPMELATTLLTLTCFQTNSTDVETRMFAPVLLRRLVETEGLPNDATYRAQMKTQLLATLVQETQPPIRRKVSHVVAQVARQDASWPELLPSIVQLTQHPDPGMQVTALDVLATLAEYTGAKLKLHHEQLGNVFASFVACTCEKHLSSPLSQQDVAPTACTEARVAAWKALSAFVVHLESSDSLQPFSHLLPPFLQLLEGSLQNHDEVAARELLTSFLAMTEVHPSLLMLHLDLIGKYGTNLTLDRPRVRWFFIAPVHRSAMLSTAQARSLSTDTRTLAIMCVLKDEGTGVRVCDAGAGAIDRVAHSVGGKVLVPLIMPYIAQYLEESTSWQRQHAALFALGLMAEGAKDYLFQVLDVWLPRILDCLQHPHPRIRYDVQEQAITAVACVAKVVGDAFVLHYSVFMPVAAHLLTQSQGKQYALLRGKAMECVALIGQAVGKEAFLNDAKAVMDILLRHETDDSGVELQYLTQACVRIASVLQEDFVAYLPLIVPKLLQQAATKPDVVLVDWNDETAATDDDDDDDEHDGIHEIVVDVQGQGKKKLQIQTSALQGKELGLNMLYQLALDLKGAFVAYVEPVSGFHDGIDVHRALNVVLPLLKFQYLDTVRMLSGLTLAKLLEAAIAGSVVTSTAPHQVLELIFEPLLTVFDKLLAVSHASVLRRVQNLSDSADDDEEEVNVEDEEAILQIVVDAIGWTIKQYKHDIVPLFVEHVAPVVNPYLEPSFPAVIRAHFICIIDDILEFGGAAVPPIMPTLLTHLWNTEQAAARDNCVSAVGKFCLYRAHLVDAPTLLGLWLNCLPLQSDAIEARAVHADLVTMVERSNMDLLGENYVHLALVLKKFADILALDLDEEFEPVLEDETKARLTAVLQHIQATYPPAIVQSAWSSLSEDDQQVFASLQ